MKKITDLPAELCYERLYERWQYLFEPDLIRDICAYGKAESFSEGQMLITIGDQITHMPLVLDGSIKIMTEDDAGDELLLYYLEVGDTCAVTLNCCTKRAKSSITAVTETACDLIFVPVERMEIWMARYHSWRQYVLESYNTRLTEMLTAIDTIVFHSMEDRIKQYLQDKAWINKSPSLTVSHADIAYDLHTSRVVVSRIMKKLEQNEFLKQKRGRVEVLQLR